MVTCDRSGFLGRFIRKLITNCSVINVAVVFIYIYIKDYQTDNGVEGLLFFMFSFCMI